MPPDSPVQNSATNRAVANDSQNAHNSTYIRIIDQAIMRLYRHYQEYLQDPNILQQIFDSIKQSKFSTARKNVLYARVNYFKSLTPVRTYTIDDTTVRLTIKDLLILIWCALNDIELYKSVDNKNESYGKPDDDRLEFLWQAILDGVGYCWTGNYNRLIVGTASLHPDIVLSAAGNTTLTDWVVTQQTLRALNHYINQLTDQEVRLVARANFLPMLMSEDDNKQMVLIEKNALTVIQNVLEKLCEKELITVEKKSSLLDLYNEALPWCEHPDIRELSYLNRTIKLLQRDTDFDLEIKDILNSIWLEQLTLQTESITESVQTITTSIASWLQRYLLTNDSQPDCIDKIKKIVELFRLSDSDDSDIEAPNSLHDSFYPKISTWRQSLPAELNQLYEREVFTVYCQNASQLLQHTQQFADDHRHYKYLCFDGYHFSHADFVCCDLTEADFSKAHFPSETEAVLVHAADLSNTQWPKPFPFKNIQRANHAGQDYLIEQGYISTLTAAFTNDNEYAYQCIHAMLIGHHVLSPRRKRIQLEVCHAVTNFLTGNDAEMPEADMNAIEHTWRQTWQETLACLDKIKPEWMQSQFTDCYNIHQHYILTRVDTDRLPATLYIYYLFKTNQLTGAQFDKLLNQYIDTLKSMENADIRVTNNDEWVDLRQLINYQVDAAGPTPLQLTLFVTLWLLCDNPAQFGFSFWAPHQTDWYEVIKLFDTAYKDLSDRETMTSLTREKLLQLFSAMYNQRIELTADDIQKISELEIVSKKRNPVFDNVCSFFGQHKQTSVVEHMKSLWSNAY